MIDPVFDKKELYAWSLSIKTGGKGKEWILHFTITKSRLWFQRCQIAAQFTQHNMLTCGVRQPWSHKELIVHAWIATQPHTLSPPDHNLVLRSLCCCRWLPQSVRDIKIGLKIPAAGKLWCIPFIGLSGKKKCSSSALLFMMTLCAQNKTKPRHPGKFASTALLTSLYFSLVNIYRNEQRILTLGLHIFL